MNDVSAITGRVLEDIDEDRLTAHEVDKLKRERAMRLHLETFWHGQDSRQWEGEPIVHLYERCDGHGEPRQPEDFHCFRGMHEVGNYPLNYGGPVTISTAVQKWARFTGRDVRSISRAVEVAGEHAVHYGIEVVDVDRLA